MLSETQIELMVKLLVDYQEIDDLSMKEWAEAQSILDILDGMLRQLDA